MIVALLFSCNFDVVMEGCEHRVYFLCHLDWLSLFLNKVFYFFVCLKVQLQLTFNMR